MSQEPPQLPPKLCLKCRAANYAHLTKCFLCHADLLPSDPNVNPYAAAGQVPVLTPLTSAPRNDLASNRVETMFLWLLVAIVVLSLLVGIGIATQDRGLLTVYLVILVPSLAAAGGRALYSMARGESPKPSKMFSAFITSALITFGIGSLLVVSFIIFVFVSCAQMLNGLGPR